MTAGESRRSSPAATLHPNPAVGAALRGGPPGNDLDGRCSDASESRRKNRAAERYPHRRSCIPKYQTGSAVVLQSYGKPRQRLCQLLRLGLGYGGKVQI